MKRSKSEYSKQTADRSFGLNRPFSRKVSWEDIAREHPERKLKRRFMNTKENEIPRPSQSLKSTDKEALHADYDAKDFKQFSRDTDNKKKKMDIEPSNLVRWRRKF